MKKDDPMNSFIFGGFIFLFITMMEAVVYSSVFMPNTILRDTEILMGIITIFAPSIIMVVICFAIAGIQCLVEKFRENKQRQERQKIEEVRRNKLVPLRSRPLPLKFSARDRRILNERG